MHLRMTHDADLGWSDRPDLVPIEIFLIVNRLSNCTFNEIRQSTPEPSYCLSTVPYF